MQHACTMFKKDCSMINVCEGQPKKPMYRVNMCVWMLPTCARLLYHMFANKTKKRHCMGWVAGEMLQCPNRWYRVSTLRGWIHLFLYKHALFISYSAVSYSMYRFLIWSYGSSMIKFYLCAWDGWQGRCYLCACCSICVHGMGGRGDASMCKQIASCFNFKGVSSPIFVNNYINMLFLSVTQLYHIPCIGF